ncbi:unnamed protein product [Hydatigera taeniaeformis]|uniref:Multifunctional methyltransferase subunit TRM112-like protein n=1 Tax=Hydatigena taeniaeformis TaxID=6205 RepID=A0A158RET4_HYDTA|nr:unnamed protein product [Hydatigera taeniaeformis]
MGTLASQHWGTLNSQTSSHGSVRLFTQWQGEGANMTHQILENAVQRTFDGWFRPNFLRDASIQYLKKQPIGGFVIRSSSRYPGFYGLSIKVKGDENISSYTGLTGNQSVRHFLIGESAEGYFQIQGTEMEPRFKSLVDLVTYHCQYAGALPCVLRLPGYSTSSTPSLVNADTPLPPLRFNESDSIEFQVLYLGAFDVYSLNGSSAVSSAMDAIFRTQSSHLRPIVVSFRVSPEGVTLTDLHCRQFLRRHFGAESFLYIGADLYGRTLMEIDPGNTNFNNGRNNMRLFTHNILTSRVLKSVKVGYPLAIKATKVDITPMDFEAKTTARFIPKVEWTVLKSAAEQVGADHVGQLPDCIPDGYETNEEFLRQAHKALMEIDVVEGTLVCPETGREFPIHNGIPNMLVNEDE